jgi:hypothetical protein
MLPSKMVETKNHQTFGKLLLNIQKVKVALLPLWFKDDL